jgi:hypothetical protein
MNIGITCRIGGEHLQFNVRCSTGKNLTTAHFKQAFVRLCLEVTFNFVIKKKKLPEYDSFYIIQN